LARAKRLYGDLIARAPSSDEAHLAHVSLGKLLLVQGQAAAAERAFQRYLESGGGPLSEEALFSRAQCLSRLGRAQPERAAWRALLAAFPESVYATEAEQRLSVLDMQTR
jgi:TolA-binding protein